MKKSCILLILAIFTFPFLTHASSFGISRPVNTLGLVGYWTFDGKDVVNGVTLDRSGNGNNGNLLNISTSTFYAQGKIGQGFRFDGVDDYINAGQNSSLDLSTRGTISIWVKSDVSYPSVDGSTNFRGIVSKTLSGGDPDIAYFIDWYGTNSARTLRANIGNGTFEQGVSVAGFDFGSSWRNIVYTFDGSFHRLYIDGILQTPVAQTINAQTVSFPVQIGRAFNNASYAWKGIIDDVRIYNRALSDTEISRLYNTGSNKISSSQKVTATSTCSSGLSCGLVGYWTFDGKDMSNGVALDRSGNGNNGNLINISTSTFYAQGKVGQGFKFDGATNYVLLPNSSVYNFSNANNFTISAWIKPSRNSVVCSIIDKEDAGGNGGYYFSLSNLGTMRLVLRDNIGASVLNSDASYEANKWIHAVVTFSSPTGVTFYKDGVNAGNKTASLNFLSVSSAPVIGHSNNVGTDYCNGVIDDVRIYNRALSTTEVSGLYSQGASNRLAISPKVITTNCSSGLSCGLVGYWTFDGKDMSNGVALDRSGSGNNGNLINISTSTFYAQGKVGQGFKFDNATNYVNIPGFSGISGLNTASISLWAKPTTTSNGQAIISQWNSDRLFDFNTTGNVLNISWRYGGSGGTGSTLNLVTAPNNFVANVWQHYVFIYDNGTASVYRNGVFVTSVGGGGTLNSAINDPLRIGWNNIPGFFSGTIDDVRIYNRVLSQIDISSLYNIGR